jgi:hypothetical protein
MAGGQCRGLQSRLPAFLDIPSVTVDEFQRLMPSFEAAIQAPMGLCAPSIVSGCTSHSGTRWFNRDKLNQAKAPVTMRSHRATVDRCLGIFCADSSDTPQRGSA